MEEINYSAVEIYSGNDYTVEEIDIPKPRHTFWEKKIQFNQKEIAKSGCVFHAGYGCLLDNLGTERDYTKDLTELKELAPGYGRADKQGMYIYKGADLIRNWWNKRNLSEPIITYRVKLGSTAFYSLIGKGYSVHTGFKGNAEYNKDALDGTLDGTEFGKLTYGHSIRQSDDGKLWVVDNYLGRPNNMYEIKDLDGLLKNGVYFESGYIYIFKNDIMTQLDKDITDVKLALKKNANGESISNDSQMLEDVKKGNYTPKVQNVLMIIRSLRLAGIDLSKI